MNMQRIVQQLARPLATSARCTARPLSTSASKATPKRRVSTSVSSQMRGTDEEGWWADRGCPIVKVSDDSATTDRETTLRAAEEKARSGWVWVRWES